MSRINRQVRLVSYAQGLPQVANFELVERPLPALQPGEFLVRVIYLSMDPFPRLRMSGDEARVPQLPLGMTMIGRGVGQIVASRHADYDEGSYVVGEVGWQEYAVCNGRGLRRVDPTMAPLSTSLGALGPSGLAAYFAMLRHGNPRPGETVVVTAAAGSVGSAAGQIAAIEGARVVGIAGGAAKMTYLRETLGFAAAVDYKNTADLSQVIGEACPHGVDVFFDLVGGKIHDAVMAHITTGARIVLVGTISNYNRGKGEVDSGSRHLYRLIRKRARMSGFMVGDYAAEFPAALEVLAGWLHEGRVTYRESIVEGLAKAPAAFAALFRGENIGKQLVRVADG